MNLSEVEKWLTSASVLDDASVTSTMRSEIDEVIGHPGLLHIVGLLLGSRQAYYLQLSQIRLSDPSQVAQASVIQGKIQGIDLIRQTLLELHTPADADKQGAAR